MDVLRESWIRSNILVLAYVLAVVKKLCINQIVGRASWPLSKTETVRFGRSGLLYSSFFLDF